MPLHVLSRCSCIATKFNAGVPLPTATTLCVTCVSAAGHKSASGIEVTWFAYTVKNQFISLNNPTPMVYCLKPCLTESSFHSCLPFFLPSHIPSSFRSSLLLFLFSRDVLPSMLSLPRCAFCTYDKQPRDLSWPPPSGPSADTSTPIQLHSDSSTT